MYLLYLQYYIKQLLWKSNLTKLFIEISHKCSSTYSLKSSALVKSEVGKKEMELDFNPLYPINHNQISLLKSWLLPNVVDKENLATIWFLLHLANCK